MIHQQKYVKELLKRFKMEDTKEIDTLIVTTTKLDIDEPGSSVDQKLIHTPSTNYTPKKGRVKAIARKTVARSELSHKLDEQLKASVVQEPQIFEESFKSATEWEETISSETKQVTSSPKITSEIISEFTENLENRFVLVGTVADVETTESGNIGGKDKKKKKEKESEGAQGDVREMGKGVVESLPILVGLTEETRAMVLWSEESAEEEENLREKGGSVSGEAVEGLVRLWKRFQEPVSSVQEPLEDLLKRVSDSYNPKRKKSSEVKIPGTSRANKKRKTASSIPIETPPTRGRATRSQKKHSEAKLEKALEECKRKAAAKGKKKWRKKKVKKKRNLKKSRTRWLVWERTVLKGRLLRDLEEEGMMMLMEKLQLQSWKDMVLQMDRKLARTLIVEFMANYEIKNGKVTSVVNEVTVSFDDKELGEILGVSAEGVLTGTKTHVIPYDFILMTVLAHFKVTLKKWDVSTNKDHFGANTLTVCDYEVHTAPKEPGSSKKVSVNNNVRALVQESGAKDAEIERLKKRLTEVEIERDDLKAELANEKEKNEGILHDMLKLLQARNQEPGPSQPRNLSCLVRQTSDPYGICFVLFDHDPIANIIRLINDA
ncbi:uncharacterized protein [Nicotiana tomentosiformis]|uniref:uncharacterized protein n=1 Tax=Nicotiana tomentosiformis TaxID=4098 RepID=UPI00388C6B92